MLINQGGCQGTRVFIRHKDKLIGLVTKCRDYKPDGQSKGRLQYQAQDHPFVFSFRKYKAYST